MANKTITVEQTGSPIRREAAQRQTLIGLGLNKIRRRSTLADTPATRGMIIPLGAVTDAELHLLYRQACFCVYPSLYEGWGLPVAEALSIGKLVVCSDRASLPEVGGDLVPYLDPWHAQAWADTLIALANDPPKVLEWEARIRARYRPRSWARAAEVVAGLLGTL